MCTNQGMDPILLRMICNHDIKSKGKAESEEKQNSQFKSFWDWVCLSKIAPDLNFRRQVEQLTNF